MNNKVWLNQNLPQTLVISQFLLYLHAFFAVINQPPPWIFSSSFLRIGLTLLITFGSAAGAFGIANSQRWGYYTGIAAAVAPFVILFQIARIEDIRFAIEWNIVGLVFDIGLLAALLHRQSGEYQRIYFR